MTVLGKPVSCLRHPPLWLEDRHAAFSSVQAIFLSGSFTGDNPEVTYPCLDRIFLSCVLDYLSVEHHLSSSLTVCSAERA